jgi:hypothetical protein
MSVTYSINPNSSIETTRKVDVNSVLQSLPNNTQKLIKPRDVRDAFLSTWSNSAFKLTKIKDSNIEYIGLDSGNPNDRDIKNKILLGKRNYGNNDIMNNELLNSNSDIFFYNTKKDIDEGNIVDQSSTKIAILSGTNSESHINSPYLESFATASQFNFNIVNPSGGDISLRSITGNVYLNDIPFPKIDERPNDGDILKYNGIWPLGKLEWTSPELTSTTNIGSINQETNIFGDGVNLNGFSLEFISDSLVPETIGGIQQGNSFSIDSFNGQNWPISEVIRLLIYPYIEPKLEINAFNQNTGFPFGDLYLPSQEITLTYSVTTFARESSEDIKDIKIFRDSTIIQNIGDFSGDPGSITFSSISGITVSGAGPFIFGISASNTIDGSINVISSTVSYEFIEPFIQFSIESNSINNIPDSEVLNGGLSASSILNSFLQDTNTNRVVLPFDEDIDIVFDFSGVSSTQPSFLYFAYPFSYNELESIQFLNTNFISSISSYTYSIIGTTTSTGNQYRIYKSNSQIIIDSDLVGVKLIFKE